LTLFAESKEPSDDNQRLGRAGRLYVNLFHSRSSNRAL